MPTFSKVMRFTLRESLPFEPGAYALDISDSTDTIMEIYLYTGDVVRLQKALQEAGFK